MYISRIIQEREKNKAMGERSVKKPLAITQLEKNFGEQVCLAIVFMSQFGLGLLSRSKERSLVNSMCFTDAFVEVDSVWRA